MSNPYHCTCTLDCTLDTVVLCFLMPVLLVMILALLRTESVEVEAEHVDDRSVDDLLSFINGENGDSKEVKAPKNKKKKSRRKDQQKNAPPVCTVSDTSSSPNNAIKEPNGVSSVGHDDKVKGRCLPDISSIARLYFNVFLQMMKSYIWLQTADGSIQQVEQEVAIFCPFICHEIHAGVGSSKTYPISLPAQVNPVTLSLILDYCRFHQVAGRSNKERKSFDEKFIRMDTNRLCELISAADSLKLKPLVDLTSRALARMIEGRTPEDLTEEEKLEALKNSTVRGCYCCSCKRKELKEKEKLKESNGVSSVGHDDKVKGRCLPDISFHLKLQDSVDEFDDIGDDREVEDFGRSLSLGQDRRPSLYTVHGNGSSAKRSSSTGLERHEK